MFIITLNYNAETFYLRNTVWSSSQERATRYENRVAANKGLETAKKFMKTAQFKASRIEEI